VKHDDEACGLPAASFHEEPVRRYRQLRSSDVSRGTAGGQDPRGDVSRETTSKCA
jgi:hypothetical protein